MIARIRSEFAGLRPTPLVKDLAQLGAGLAVAAAGWAVVVFFIWAAS